MSPYYWGLAIGLLLGGCLGFFACALLTISKMELPKMEGGADETNDGTRGERQKVSF